MIKRTSRLLRGIKNRNRKLIIVIKATLSFYIFIFGVNYLVNATEASFSSKKVTNATITAGVWEEDTDGADDDVNTPDSTNSPGTTPTENTETEKKEPTKNENSSEDNPGVLEEGINEAEETPAQQDTSENNETTNVTNKDEFETNQLAEQPSTTEEPNDSKGSPINDGAN